VVAEATAAATTDRALAASAAVLAALVQ
jgi:hypothetical protein